MIQITVTAAPIKELKGTGKASGKPYHMRIQTAYAYTVDKDGNLPDFPDKFEISLGEGQPPYEKGIYTLSPSSIYISREGRLETKPVLVLLKQKS